MKVFISHSAKDEEVVSSVMAQFQKADHDVFAAGETAAGKNLASEISAAIRSTDVLVAVVTSASANVFYELGLAAGAGVPILITAPVGGLLPSDLASVPYVQLTGDILRDAQTIVRRAEELEGLATTRATSFGSAEAALRAASRDPAVLESMAPPDFERLIAGLFKERGYDVAQTDPARDAGVDLVMTSQKDKEIVLIVLKKLSRQSRVSVEAVRQLLGAVVSVGASAGMLVSTTGFTSAALALAANTPIVLRTLEEVLGAKSLSELLESARSVR
jgi:hypothetical protein